MKHKPPKVEKFSSLSWLVEFLNLQFDSEKPKDRNNVDKFLANLFKSREDIPEFQNVQGEVSFQIAQALKTFSPLGITYYLNQWVQTESVHPWWVTRPLEKVPTRDASSGVLKLGFRKWHTISTALAKGVRGTVLMPLAQCLTNGELGLIQRCDWCKCFFVTDDRRRKFCGPPHQQAYNASTAAQRVKLSREKRKAKKANSIRVPKKKALEPLPPAITEAQQFASFLEQTKGAVIPDSELALFIKKQIPGDWQTIRNWYKQSQSQSTDAIWDSVAAQTKKCFREKLWHSDVL